MAKVRTRPETGLLYLDFFYRGVRCREQTALPDTVENRRRVQALMNRMSKEIKQGLFDYATTFPGSPRAAQFAGPSASIIPTAAGGNSLPSVSAIPDTPTLDRKSAVEGKSVTVLVDPGGRGDLKQK